MNVLDKIDVTDRAIGGGWTLPEGWRVLAWTEPDDGVSDPRDNGDCYATDIDEADHHHPAHGFCQHCESWICKVDAAQAEAINTGVGWAVADPDDPQASAGDWASLDTGNIERLDIMCPERDGGLHELGEPMVVRWWRADRWSFVGVCVQVHDAEDAEWGEASLWSVESGCFPLVDQRSGEVTATELDPLTDPDHPLPELIDEALRAACDRLDTARRQRRRLRRLWAWLRALPLWHVPPLPVIVPPPAVAVPRSLPVTVSTPDSGPRTSVADLTAGLTEGVDHD